MLSLILNIMNGGGASVLGVLLDGMWSKMTDVDWEDVGDTDWDDTTGITLTKRSSTFSGTWSSIDHATGGGLITNNHTFPLGFGTYYPSMHTGLYIIFQEDMSDTTSLSNDYQAKVVMRYYVTGV